MSETITPAISDRICAHMNQDHGDALVLYARVFGESPGTQSAQMISIDPQGMNLVASIEGESKPIRIQFDHTLESAEDAHHTLVDMIKQARKS
ncbi:MAG: hypothetical protein N5P05_003741 [Chroococcopsis gigantea SAG 12.99]|jgi:putative heme iron utilization protein|nr:hypothetical protein [Chroococcopsis gigantea SAG 12.99]